MTDRELLTYAAKAAEVPRVCWDYKFCRSLGHMVAPSIMWNPLKNDGEALRLAASLNIGLHWCPSGRVYAYADDKVEAIESSREDRQENLRRAIVRAAAEIGRSRHG